MFSRVKFRVWRDATVYIKEVFKAQSCEVSGPSNEVYLAQHQSRSENRISTENCSRIVTSFDNAKLGSVQSRGVEITEGKSEFTGVEYTRKVHHTN